MQQKWRNSSQTYSQQQQQKKIYIATSDFLSLTFHSMFFQVLQSLDELGDYIKVKFSRHRSSYRPELYDETDFELDS